MIYIKESVYSLPEDSLCKDVVIPLLKAMGYQDVYYYHGGSGEQGKDIVCWEKDKLGSRKNLAIVAKAIKISGKAAYASGTTSEITTQIQQCFGGSYLDNVSAEPQKIHECWVVSNKEITKEAIVAIESSLHSINLVNNTSFIGFEKLWELIEKYLPVDSVFNKLQEVGEVLSTVDPHYQPRITLDLNNRISLEILEKYPGASIEKPIVLSTVFQFPSTPEGTTAKEAFTRSIETGEPSEIPLEFLKSLELPDIFKTLFKEVDYKKGSLQIGEVVNPKHLFIKIQILCRDGDKSEIEGIDLCVKWQGSKKTTLVNIEENRLFNISLEIYPERSTADIAITKNKLLSRNAYQLFLISYTLNCLSKPCSIKLIDQHTGLTFLSQETEGLGEPISQNELDLLNDFAELQKKNNFPIILPLRSINDEEDRIISSIRSIVHKPIRFQKWVRQEARFDAKGINQILQTIKDKGVVDFHIEAEQKVRLFEQDISLGKMKITFKNAIVENIEEIQQKMENPSMESSINVVFIPKNPKEKARVEFLDWIL